MVSDGARLLDALVNPSESHVSVLCNSFFFCNYLIKTVAIMLSMSCIGAESMTFQGVYTAIVTPFVNGKVDTFSLTKMVEQQLRAGIDGIVVCGTTGESATLSDDEIVEVTKQVMSVSAGGCKVIAGVGTNDTAHSIDLVRRTQDLNVDGALVITPYYNKPSQSGLLAHFYAVAEAADELPLMLYTVPGRTGVHLELKTFESLVPIPNVIALKDATADLALSAEYARAAGNDVSVLSGDDVTALPMWSVGGSGLVSVAANLCPKLMVAMWQAHQSGKQAEASEIHARLLPLFRALFWESNPMPVKHLMARLGLIAENTLRLPLVPVSKVTASRLNLCFDALEIDCEFARE